MFVLTAGSWLQTITRASNAKGASSGITFTVRIYRSKDMSNIKILQTNVGYVTGASSERLNTILTLAGDNVREIMK